MQGAAKTNRGKRPHPTPTNSTEKARVSRTPTPRPSLDPPPTRRQTGECGETLPRRGVVNAKRGESVGSIGATMPPKARLEEATTGELGSHSLLSLVQVLPSAREHQQPFITLSSATNSPSQHIPAARAQAASSRSPTAAPSVREPRPAFGHQDDEPSSPFMSFLIGRSPPSSSLNNEHPCLSRESTTANSLLDVQHSLVARNQPFAECPDPPRTMPCLPREQYRTNHDYSSVTYASSHPSQRRKTSAAFDRHFALPRASSDHAHASPASDNSRMDLHACSARRTSSHSLASVPRERSSM
ncbi:3'-5'-exoribonuclease family protein [Striga asiatica]|uniref:3'-5'-exoribonuclease family protein n=1 Tax=Striga asiatica TaxID=4170 RepID=A0A5A7PCB8_STRAF|nr:3'-5'-exoribonuclease family protein [Striga asiatica]